MLHCSSYHGNKKITNKWQINYSLKKNCSLETVLFYYIPNAGLLMNTLLNRVNKINYLLNFDLIHRIRNAPEKCVVTQMVVNTEDP